MVGDSITADPIKWWAGVQSYVDAHISAPVGAWINSGVPGDKVADVLARVNADVNAHHPNVVVIEVGVNDVGGGTDPATFRTTYASLIVDIRAANPTVRIALVSVFALGEQYPDPLNTTIVNFNWIIQSLAIDYGCVWIDARTPQQAYEAANNTPSPGVVSGVLTIETPPTLGEHPNATGKSVIYTPTALAKIVAH